MLKRTLLSAVAAATFAVGASLSATAAVIVNVAPPAPRYEAAPALRPGYVWTPGYWNWDNRRYVWIGGRYARERPGYVYRSPAWVQQGDRWQMERGAWDRHDRDHDGVRNRRDDHPNNPNRR